MIVALLLYLFVFVSHASASTSSVVIVNQVRGTECCEAGSLEHLNTQLSFTTKLGMSATYALRYDSLQNEEMVSKLKAEQKKYQGLIHLGAFLEITPSLAKDSGILYTAPERDWYKTTHVYPPGYSREDRIAIIDTYMATYTRVFGEYPNLTVGWFVDTFTLNYLHDKYDVLVHELTREQWGTDSYTLSGGPTHYPFVSGRNWSFLPGSGGITIIRQTISDPRYNYGDATSSFTGQPNDYGSNKDFNYFNSLLATVLNQPGDQPGFAVFGLENSMEAKYQEEYSRQLEHLAANYQDVNYLGAEDIVELASRDQVSLYAGEGAYTITTLSYRMRLIVEDQKVMVTDLRLYDQKITDPYESSRVLNSGYFIAPYLIDGSRWFQFKSSWLSSLLKPKYNVGYGARNDSLTLPSHLAFPPIKKNHNIQVAKNNESYTLSYLSSSNKQVSLHLRADKIETQGLSINDFSFKNLSGGKVPVKESKTHDSYHLAWYNKDTIVMSLDGSCKKDLCTFIPFLDADKFETARKDQPFLLLPTRIEDQDTSGTLLYPSLTYLVYGRSPARIVVLPRNKQGIPVGLSSPVEFSSPGLTVLSDPLYLQSQEAQFYDFSAAEPGKYSVKVTVPGVPSAHFDFYFARDCRREVSYCLQHPGDLYTYVRAIIAGKLGK